MSVRQIVTKYPDASRPSGVKVRFRLPPLNGSLPIHHAVGPMVASDETGKSNGVTILSATSSGAHIAVDSNEYVVFPFLETSPPFHRSTPLMVPRGSTVQHLSDSVFVATSPPQEGAEGSEGAMHVRVRRGREYIVSYDATDSEMLAQWGENVRASDITAASAIEFEDNVVALYLWNTREADPLICSVIFDLETRRRTTAAFRIPCAAGCFILTHIHYNLHSVFVGTNSDGVLNTFLLDHDEEKIGRLWSCDTDGVLHCVRGFDYFTEDTSACLAREVTVGSEYMQGASKEETERMPSVKLITAKTEGLQGGPRAKKSRSFFIDDEEDAAHEKGLCSTSTQHLQARTAPPSTVAKIIRDQTCPSHCAVLYNDSVVVTYTMTDTGYMVEETSYANVAAFYSYFGGHILVRLRDSRGFVINMRPSHDTQFVNFLQHTPTPYPERGAAYIGMVAYLASTEARRAITQGRLFMGIVGFDTFFRDACRQQRDAEENGSKLVKLKQLYGACLEENKRLYDKIHKSESTHMANEAVYRKAARMSEEARDHSEITSAENAFLRAEMQVARRDLFRQNKFFLELAEQLPAVGKVPEGLQKLLSDIPATTTKPEAAPAADATATITPPVPGAAQLTELYRHHFLAGMASPSPRPGAIEIDGMFVVPIEIAAHLKHHVISGAQLGAAQQMLGEVISFLVERNRDAHTSAREALQKAGALEKELEAAKAKLAARNKNTHDLAVANKRAKEAESQLAAESQKHVASIAQFEAQCADYAARCDRAERRLLEIEEQHKEKERANGVLVQRLWERDIDPLFIREHLVKAGFSCDGAATVQTLITAAGAELSAALTREKTATLNCTLATAKETAATTKIAAQAKHIAELERVSKVRAEEEDALRQRHRTEIEKRAATIKELSARLQEKLETHQAARAAKNALLEANEDIKQRDATIAELERVSKVRAEEEDALRQRLRTEIERHEEANKEICARLDEYRVAKVERLETHQEATLAKQGLREARKTIAEREAAIAELHAHISDLSTQPRAPARNTPPPGFHGPVSPPRTPSHPAPVWYPMPLPDTAGYEQRIAILMRQVATLEGERDAYKSIVSTALAART